MIHNKKRGVRVAKVSNKVLQRYKTKTYEYFRVEFRKETDIEERGVTHNELKEYKLD